MPDNDEGTHWTDDFDFTATSEEGATFTPWTDGWAVGFKVTAKDQPDRYVYLNPSGGSDTGDILDSCVFAYLDDEPGSHEGALSHIDIWERP